MRLDWRYVAALGVCLVTALLLGFTDLASSIDGYAGDFIFRLHEPAWEDSEAALLAVDEASLVAMRGRRQLREWVAFALGQIAPVRPRAVGVDLIFADPAEEAADASLQRAFEGTQGLVLGADLLRTGGWELPLERFRRGAYLGHVHAEPDPVSRILPLMKAQAGERYWAMALEVYRQAHNAAIVEEPDALTAGAIRIPARREEAYPVGIRYRAPGRIPQVTLKELRDTPARAETFRGKAVFVGFTAQSEVKDRLMTPRGEWMAGVEIHAHAYETIRTGAFLRPAPLALVLAMCLGMVTLVGVIFYRPPGAWSYVWGGLMLMAAHLTPHLMFRLGWLFPTVAPTFAALFAVAAAAGFQYFVLRGRWRVAESDKARYREAIHFVAHEMRTPLSAIQGSSELLTRYNMSDDKRKQMATMINAESKRLARMITAFLDVERLGDGSMELKRDPVELDLVLQSCVDRARVLADRKQMTIEWAGGPAFQLTGDRELLEYAVYNLLTNAVKYSPAETVIRVSTEYRGGRVRLAVADQGMGMEEHELERIFQKFYRTKRAEQAGIEGTGIGLSLVNEIVRHHGGKIDVTSRPGEGSCFTLELPAVVRERTRAEETA